MTLRVFSLLCMVLAGFFSGCESYRPPERVGTSDSTRTEKLVPDTRLIRAEISLYDRQYTTARIYADTLVRFERFDSTMGYVVTARLLDTAGRVTTTMIGDSAVIREKSQRLQLYGHAVVSSGDTLKVESEYLEWDPQAQQLQTDKFVRIHRRKDLISGIGMTADRKLGRIRLKKQVKGSIENVDQLPDTKNAADSALDSAASRFTAERLRRALDSVSDTISQKPADSLR